MVTTNSYVTYNNTKMKTYLATAGCEGFRYVEWVKTLNSILFCL